MWVINWVNYSQRSTTSSHRLISRTVNCQRRSHHCLWQSTCRFRLQVVFAGRAVGKCQHTTFPLRFHYSLSCLHHFARSLHYKWTWMSCLVDSFCFPSQTVSRLQFFSSYTFRNQIHEYVHFLFYSNNHLTFSSAFLASQRQFIVCRASCLASLSSRRMRAS